MNQSPSRPRRFRSSERASFRDAPYPSGHRDKRNDLLCSNCKEPGHFARDCSNMALCHNCGLPGHIAAECNSVTTCWNCKERGHLASQCPNDAACHTCGNMGHRARDCTNACLPAHDTRLCGSCYKRVTLRSIAPTRKHATTAGYLVILLVTAPTTLSATSATYQVTLHVTASSQAYPRTWLEAFSLTSSAVTVGSLDISDVSAVYPFPPATTVVEGVTTLMCALPP